MKKLRITVGDKTYEVTVEVLSDDNPPRVPQPSVTPPAPTQPASAPVKKAATSPGGAAEPGAVTSPLAGVVISVLVKEGDEVERGQELLILEAMKMENQITAPVAGKVKSVNVSEGDSVPEAHVLLVLE